MEIIIHGKPNAESSKETSEINGLAHNIVDNFFRDSRQFKVSEALVVDARFWKGIWYSVYTYVRNGNIRDTVDRDSYFALSVIIPKVYYCLISEVYLHLKRIYENDIIGAYLSKNGKYLVPTFSDNNVFTKIVEKCRRDYTNMTEVFDSEFVPQESLKTDVCYHLEDCDSKAFVACLKKQGRIIVTENTSTKNERIADAKKYRSLYEKTRADLEMRNTQIDTLKKEITEKESSNGSKIQKLNKSIESLKDENDKLKSSNKTLKESNDNFKIKFDKITEVLGFPQTTETENRRIKDPLPPTINRTKSIIWLTLTYVILMILVVFFAYNWCTQSLSITELKEEIESLHEHLQQKEDELIGLEEEIDKLSNKDHYIDVDCQISIYQDNRPINDVKDVDLSRKVIINISKPIVGYEWYSDNLKNKDQLNDSTSMELKLKPIDRSKPIIIVYRSIEREKTNPKNRFEFNSK